jgi:hypothetical protein
MTNTNRRASLASIAPLVLGSLGACVPPGNNTGPRAGAEYWNTTTTRSPPVPDAESPGSDPGEPIPADARGPGRSDPPARPDVRPADGPANIAPSDASAGPVPSGPMQPCMLTFSVTTASYNGSYGPRNVGAIWISDASGTFVKSLNVWGAKRRRHLTTWNDVSGGNTVDAVTGATASNHATRTGIWNCTGADRKPVADGSYRVNVDITEANSGERVMTPLSFTKGPGPVDVTVPDQANFKTIHLRSAP